MSNFTLSEKSKTNMEGYGGRRFLMTMGCGLVSTALLWFGKISGSEYVTLVTLTVVPYIAFNTQQKIQEVKSERSN